MFIVYTKYTLLPKNVENYVYNNNVMRVVYYYNT